MDVVYATGTTHVTLESGQRVVVHKGTHWPADDPVVRQQPTLFSTDVRYGLMYTVEPQGYNMPTEQATAVPGEKRNARRN